MIDTSPCRDFALEIVQRLARAGYRSLWAGGSVRDLILGETPADYDVATAATPEQVLAALPFQAVTVGISFGVVRVRHPRLAGVEVEVATFRSDGAYVDGRRPESVVFGSPELDAARRDFTVNGMFMNPLTGEVIDYVGGQVDLQNRILRAIGDPAARLREDKLRALRAVRLAARFQLQIEPATRLALRSMAAEIVTVSAERIAQELRRMLVHQSRSHAMNLAMDTGLVAAILSPLIPMKGLFQGKPIQPEGDLWDHTMLVLELLPLAPSVPLAFAALLHDAGKPATREYHQGRASFHNHEHAGARIADRLCRQLKLSNDERARITWLVAFHQYLGEARKLRESKLKQILAEPGIDDLLELHRADALASTGHSEDVEYCRYYLEAQPAGPINPPPLLTGHDLVRHGLEPGPAFAALLDSVREAQLEGLIQSKREALTWVDQRIADKSLGELLVRSPSARKQKPSRDERRKDAGNDDPAATVDRAMNRPLPPRTTAVLVSGGLDSAILSVDLLSDFARVVPLYIRSGLRWEDAELAALGRFLSAVARDGLEQLVILDEPIADVYGAHWSTSGASVPGEDTPDEAVYLPGRNLLLTVKAAIWCRLHEIGALALGSLGSNPFPDSTPDFFEKLELLLNQAMGGNIRLIRPFKKMHKTDVLMRGKELPLHLTFSCINPAEGIHCGSCNKCAERKNGFRDAGLPDCTAYRA